MNLYLPRFCYEGLLRIIDVRPKKQGVKILGSRTWVTEGGVGSPALDGQTLSTKRVPRISLKDVNFNKNFIETLYLIKSLMILSRIIIGIKAPAQKIVISNAS